ncbi:MAG: ABC transporter permease [Bryobacteraceae bacterium]
MDLRVAFRTLIRKNAGFTAIAVLILALGIGANTAVFSVVNAVLLKPLSYNDPDRIVTLWSLNKTNGRRYQVSAPDFHDWKKSASSFESMGYYYYAEKTSVAVANTAEYAQVAGVTPEFFAAMGALPAIGHGLDPHVQTSILIGDAFWRRHFNGDSGALGKTVRLMDKSFVIAGVMPPRFDFPNKADLWFQASLYEETASRTAHNYRPIARLRPGVTVEQAQAEMTAIAAAIERQYPEDKNKSAAVVPLAKQLVGDVQTTLYLLLGAVALVLLIACANVASLLLARATARTREMAVRAALGASRWMIIRQLLAESLVLAALAGAAGLLLGIWGTEILVGIAPAGVPRLDEVHLDLSVLAFTFVLSLAASVLFGLAPAFQATRIDLNDALKQAGGRTVGGRGGFARQSLVVAEVALSVILLTAAGLLLKSFVGLTQVDLGIHAENILAAEMDVPAGDLESSKAATRFYTRLLPDLRALPGVTAATASQTLTAGRSGSNGGYFLEGTPMPPPADMPYANFRIIAPGYFETVRVPLKSGREFAPTDQYESPFVAIVNETFVKRTFKTGEYPLGRRVLCGLDSPNPMQIVGVVADVREDGPTSAVTAELYMPYTQHPGPGSALFVMLRTQGNPQALANAVRLKVRDVRTDVPIKFTTMEANVAGSVAAPRFRSMLLTVFAVLAVALAMAGIYGLMAYMVARRAAEIGVRMALGARREDVLRMVLVYGLRLALPGVALGLAGAYAASRFLASLLYGVRPTDPATYAGTAALLLVVSVAAGIIPARRAAALDPLVALRQE